LGASSSRGKMRSWILTSRESAPPWRAIASAGTCETRSAIRSLISMMLDIIWELFGSFKSCLKTFIISLSMKK